MPTLGTKTTLNRLLAGTSAQQGKTKKSQTEETSLTSVSSNSGYLPGGAQWFTAHTRGLV